MTERQSIESRIDSFGAKHWGKLMTDKLYNDNIFKLGDGKQVGYAEYGNPAGIPILVHHGNPGSRLFWGLLPSSPFDDRYRLIAPDRPGYGLSDHYGKASIQKWPSIIQELMDYLGVDTFHNVGVSGGGPYALACSAALHQRIRKTALISPVGPFLAESIGQMNVNRKLFALANKLPWLIKIQFAMTSRMLKRNPDHFINLFTNKLEGPDREMIEREEIRTLLKRDFVEAYRQGAAGSIYDCFIPGDWPIDLAAIKGPVAVWYGELDRSIGDMGKYIGEGIPSAVSHCIPGLGHLLVFEKAGEIMKKLVDDSVSESRPVSPPRSVL